MRFLLCVECHRAWHGPAEPCDRCGAEPVDCSPWSADGRQWYMVRVRHKIAGIYEVLTSDDRVKRKALVRGIRAKGNTSARLVA
jgi:hypothetical protein